MRNGTFVAVAKFRRNTCYTADLSGQLTSSMNQSQVNACRGAFDEIVVSDPVAIASLNVNVKTDFSFQFVNPIRIEATDLFLQVVFKGTLGEEVGAVAVTTKDVSEPTFFGYANLRDYEVCLPDATGPCRTNDWPPNTRASDLTIVAAAAPTAEQLAPYSPHPYTGTTRSLASLDWLGFSREHPSYKVAKLPVNGIAPGAFVRIALIGEIDQPTGLWPLHLDRAYYPGNKTFSLVNGATGVGTAGTYEDPAVNFMAVAELAKNDLPFLYGYGCGVMENPDGAILSETGTTGQGNAIITREAYEGLFFGIGRLRLAEVQANIDGVLEPTSLPRYHRFRGATLGIRVDRADRPREFGFMAANPLGDLGAIGWVPYNNGVSAATVPNNGYIEHSAIQRFSDEMATQGLSAAPPLSLTAMATVGFSQQNRRQFASQYVQEKTQAKPVSEPDGCISLYRAGEASRTRFERGFFNRGVGLKAQYSQYPSWD